MRVSRYRLLGFVIFLLLAGCDESSSHSGAAQVRARTAEARAASVAWLASSRGTASVGMEQAVALGYLERQRVGLGGPFRLIEYARLDPRLSDAARRQVAWALLTRTAAGQSYEIDASVLDQPAGAGLVRSGDAHVRLITSAVEEAADARAGELAVRLGYALAAAEGLLGSDVPRIAARVAALQRDRVLARRDARVVLDSARSSGVDALALVHRWRLERRLSSEAPFLAPLDARLERQAVEMAPRLAAGLRELAAGRPERARSRERSSQLSAAAARSLLAASASLNAPPLAPIAVALSGYRDQLLAPNAAAGDRAERRALAASTREEELVARRALVREELDASPALAVLWAAADMRTLAQEPVWYPGFGGPTARELEQRYGLAAVTFGRAVPGEWRPYYRRLLQSAIEDMRLVLPALDVRGLRVRFDAGARPDATLALHDPRRREIVLPVASAAGTLAHEIAHDLDWQVAKQRYHVRGAYATDRTQRVRRRGDALALRLQELFAGATVPEAASAKVAAHARRPAEIFARNIDWYAAVSLARTGRMNGYLTSVQDELLTGYGTARPPELSGAAGDALMRVLDVVAPVYPDARAWFLRNYGTDREVRSYDVARGVLESTVPATRSAPALPNRAASGADVSAFARLRRSRDAQLATVTTLPCALTSAEPSLQAARRALVLAAAGARARGLALERVRALGDSTAARRLLRDLYGAPFGAGTLSAEEEAFVQQLTEGVRAVERAPLPQRGSGFELVSAAGASGC